MSKIKELGLSCYNAHIMGDKQGRNYKLVELQVLIRKKLGHRYISYDINNTETRINDDGQLVFPSITFRIKKNKNDSILSICEEMMNLFEINSFPPIILWYDTEFEVVLDISEYWKNMICEGVSTKTISPDLIQLFTKLEYDERHKLCKEAEDLIFLFDSYDVLVNNIVTETEKQESTKKDLLEFAKKKREWYENFCKYLVPYDDLSYDEKQPLIDSALIRMNEYINWHFAEIVCKF